MGATPIADHRDEGRWMPIRYATEGQSVARRRELAGWGFVAHPALKPTVFTPSGSAPAGAEAEEEAVRKV